MSRIEQQPYGLITSQSAWTSKSVGGANGLMYRLNERHLRALDEVLGSLSGKSLNYITKDSFSHPDLADVMSDIQTCVVDGRGAMIVQGIGRERYLEEDFERIVLGIGTQIGNVAVQSREGDRLRHVRQEPNPSHSYLRSNKELELHCDENEISCLMSVEVGETGGCSQIASGIAVYNEMVRKHKDLLPYLFEGYPFSVARVETTKEPVTPYKMPVFSWHKGKLACFYIRIYMEAAATQLGEEMPPKLVEALNCFDSIANNSEIRVDHMLSPGEILITNNYYVMHAREFFTDSETRKRHLLRVWSNPERGYPLDPDVSRFFQGRGERSK